MGFIAAMIVTSSGNAKFRCEVCIAFEGNTKCGNGAGTTQTEAQRVATEIACSGLTSGNEQPGALPQQRSEGNLETVTLCQSTVRSQPRGAKASALPPSFRSAHCACWRESPNTTDAALRLLILNTLEPY